MDLFAEDSIDLNQKNFAPVPTILGRMNSTNDSFLMLSKGLAFPYP
jgi:hypothetical protein